jgi:hypothetical protein
MKVGSPTLVGCKGVILAIAIVVGWLFAPAYCKNRDVALLLQQTPAQGGATTPVAGVYHFVPGSEVTLTAVPERGYQFNHWLGEVSDPTASSTVVYLDKPKVIVAVFKQTKYGILGAGESLPTGGGGGGGLIHTGGDYGKPVALSTGGGQGGKRRLQSLADSKSTEGVSEVPEPATAALLVMGGLLAFARRGRKKPAR